MSEMAARTREVLESGGRQSSERQVNKSPVRSEVLAEGCGDMSRDSGAHGVWVGVGMGFAFGGSQGPERCWREVED